MPDNRIRTIRRRIGIAGFAPWSRVWTIDRMQNAEPPIATVDVLVIDDNESVRHVVNAALLNYGYAVETAAIEPTAIELLRCVRPRLIIAGTFTPEATTIEVLVAMKAHGVPLVAMSDALVLTPEMEARVAREFGAAQVLARPFRLQTLLATVRQIIGEPECRGGGL
jgi:two-component system, OmpR family, response regulator